MLQMSRNAEVLLPNTTYRLRFESIGIGLYSVFQVNPTVFKLSDGF